MFIVYVYPANRLFCTDKQQKGGKNSNSLTDQNFTVFEEKLYHGIILYATFFYWL